MRLPSIYLLSEMMHGTCLTSSRHWSTSFSTFSTTSSEPPMVSTLQHTRYTAVIVLTTSFSAPITYSRTLSQTHTHTHTHTHTPLRSFPNKWRRNRREWVIHLHTQRRRRRRRRRRRNKNKKKNKKKRRRSKNTQHFHPLILLHTHTHTHIHSAWRKLAGIYTWISNHENKH